MDTIASSYVELSSSLEAYAFAEHRELLEVKLSEEVMQIGNHAFYNCRNLKRLSFWDTLQEVGDGAFKNCGMLSELMMIQSGQGNSAALKNILSELSGEFLISFFGKENQLQNQLFMPSYLHDYEENTEARIINQITYGAGVHYRECIQETGMDYAAYDRLFLRCISLDPDAAWQVAFYRCAFPWELRKEAASQYRNWLLENQEQVLEHLCQKRRESETGNTILRIWLGLNIYQTEENWKKAIEQVRKQEDWEAVALLMQKMQEWKNRQGEKEEQKGHKNGKRTKKFEF